MPTRIDYMVNRYIHPPNKSVTMYTEELAKIHEESKGKLFTFGTPKGDEVLLPFRRGKLYTLIARPGHGKTTTLVAFAKRAATLCEEKEIVIYLTYETPAEEIELMLQNNISLGSKTMTDIARGNFDLDDVTEKVFQRTQLPIWIVGMSLKYGVDSISQESLTIESVIEMLESVRQDGYKIKAIMVDFIQKIPSQSFGLLADRYKTVTESTYMLRRLGTEFDVPIIVGVQAKQVVDDKANPIPDMNGAEWSAAITQECDTAIALWRPIRTYPNEVSIKIGNDKYLNGHELMIMKLLKQRLHIGVAFIPLNFNMATLEYKDANVI